MIFKRFMITNLQFKITIFIIIIKFVVPWIYFYICNYFY